MGKNKAISDEIIDTNKNSLRQVFHMEIALNLKSRVMSYVPDFILAGWVKATSHVISQSLNFYISKIEILLATSHSCLEAYIRQCESALWVTGQMLLTTKVYMKLLGQIWNPVQPLDIVIEMECTDFLSNNGIIRIYIES